MLLLDGQMAAVNVRADDEGIGIDRAVEYDHLVDGEKILACHNARRADNCRTDLDLNGVKLTAARQVIAPVIFRPTTPRSTT